MKEEYIVLAILGMVLLTAITLSYAPNSITGQQISSVQAQTCRQNSDCKGTNLCTIGTCANGRCEYKPIECPEKKCKKSLGCKPATGCAYENLQPNPNNNPCSRWQMCCNGRCMDEIDAYVECVQGGIVAPVWTETPQITPVNPENPCPQIESLLKIIGFLADHCTFEFDPVTKQWEITIGS